MLKSLFCKVLNLGSETPAWMYLWRERVHRTWHANCGTVTIIHVARGRYICFLILNSSIMWPDCDHSIPMWKGSSLTLETFWSHCENQTLGAWSLEKNGVHRRFESLHHVFYHPQPWGSCMVLLTVMVLWRISRKRGIIWLALRQRNLGSSLLIAACVGRFSPSFCSTLHNNWTASMLYVYTFL